MQKHCLAKAPVSPNAGNCTPPLLDIPLQIQSSAAFTWGTLLVLSFTSMQIWAPSMPMFQMIFTSLSLAFTMGESNQNSNTQVPLTEAELNYMQKCFANDRMQFKCRICAKFCLLHIIKANQNKLIEAQLRQLCVWYTFR